MQLLLYGMGRAMRPANLNQQLLAMKLLGILVFVIGLDLQANSQLKEIRLQFTQAKLETVLRSIEQQSSYRFTYSSEAMGKTNPVTINLVTPDIQQVLKVCLTNQPLSFSVEENIIILKYLEKPIPVPQQAPFKGLLLDEQGLPVIGATITVKGTDRSAMSDNKGQFSLVVLQPGDVLVITSVAFETLEWPVRGRSGFTFHLQKKVIDLDEAVVKGYYVSTKRLNTGSVSKIDSKVIERQVVNNPLSAMQGRISGVFINTLNGLPGGNISVFIRGKGSLNAGTDPLYIVDGVPFNSTPLNQDASVLTNGIIGAISPLNSINPADIQSIEVLKDADATAIYGSRGANGVVLITTKKGASGKLTVDLSYRHGVTYLGARPDLLGLKDYLAMRREAFANDGIEPTTENAPDLLTWDTTKGTDWVNYFMGNSAPMHQVNLSLKGGNELTNFILSSSYRDEGYVFPGKQHYRRFASSAGIHHQSRDGKFSLDYSGTYSSDDNQHLASSVLPLLLLPPNIPMNKADGTISWDGFDSDHPVAILTQRASAKSESLINNLVMRYRLGSNLTAKLNLGLTKNRLDQVMTYPGKSLNPLYGAVANANFGDNRQTTILVEPQLDYSKALKWAIISASLGSTYQQSNRKGDFLNASNFSNDDLLENPSAASTIFATATSTEYKYAAVFGRLNFNVHQRYLVNFTVRRDGSSRFGTSNRFGNFGAVGAAWIFSSENWIKQHMPWMTFGKLRASYGITGNDLIGDYRYLSTYRFGGIYQGQTALGPTRLANPDFGWESNRKLEIALEMNLFSNRVSLTTAWYRNVSGNQLLDYPVPYTSGPFGNYQANYAAKILNTGLEVDFTGRVIQQANWGITVSGNITVPRNKLLAYPGLAQSSLANSLEIGEDITIRKGYRYLGVDPATGLPMFDDINKDGVIGFPFDNVTIGKLSPDWFGGFGMDIHFRRFTFGSFFQFSKQYVQGLSTLSGTMTNTFSLVDSRWRTAGDLTAIPKSTTMPGMEYFLLPFSDAAFFNSTYLRLKTLSLGYSISNLKLGGIRLSNGKLFVDAQNLLTWRKAGNVVDPESGNYGIPPLTTIVGGIHLIF